MKARFALVAVLMLVGAVSIVGLGAKTETGVIGATIPVVLTVTMTGSPINFTIDPGATVADVGGAGVSDPFIEIGVVSNVTYTVNLACSGNLQLQGAASNGLNEIETEYAIWKHIEWHDWYTQQVTPHVATGWVFNDVDGWKNNTDPYWFEATTGGGIQGGHSTGDETATNNLPFPTGNLPEHDDNYTWAPMPLWDADWYNHGADLTLRFYPFLDVFEEYGTRAGSYSGSITAMITSVNGSVP